MKISVPSSFAMLGLALSAAGGMPEGQGRHAVTSSVAGDRVAYPAAMAADAAMVNSNKDVYPPDSKPFGRTYGEWATDWWRWVVGIPAQITPSLDPDGAQCAVNQPGGPVWFLGGTFGSGSPTRTCAIPHGKALLFPIMEYLNDYPCPPPFEPAPGQPVGVFLADGAKQIIDLTDSLEVEVDGKGLVDLFSYRQTSSLFPFTAAINLQAFDACVTGSPQLGAADGFWILLKPLPVGAHVIHIKGTIAPLGLVNEVTYMLTVAP